MKFRVCFFVILAMLAGCQDKYEEALSDVTNITKNILICDDLIFLKRKTEDCANYNALAFDIAIKKTQVLGIKNERIDAAKELGEMQYRLENTELIEARKIKIASDAKKIAAAKEEVWVARNAELILKKCGTKPPDPSGDHNSDEYQEKSNIRLNYMLCVWRLPNYPL